MFKSQFLLSKKSECVYLSFTFRDSSSPTYTSSVTSIFTMSSEPTKGNDKNMNETALIAVTLLCVLLMISLAVTIVLLCTKKCKSLELNCNSGK